MILPRTTQVDHAPGMIFEAISEIEGDSRHLALHGELDVATHSVLERELRAVDLGPERSISVDLAGLTFVDSGGVVLLMQAAQLAATCEKTFVLLHPRPIVIRLLEIFEASHLVGCVPESPSPELLLTVG